MQQYLKKFLLLLVFVLAFLLLYLNKLNICDSNNSIEKSNQKKLIHDIKQNVSNQTIIQIFPENKKFLILMITNEISSEITRLSIQDKIDYALRHQYSLVIDSPRTSRPVAWSKLVSILNLFDQGYEWIWCLDRDTIITNPFIEVLKLLDRIHKNYSIVMSHDCETINTGSMFLRNTQWTKNFIKKVQDAYITEVVARDNWFENRAFSIFYDRNEDFMYAKLFLLPQWSINVYPIENKCSNKRPYMYGDFLLHFAGMTNYGTNSLLYVKYFNANRNSLNDLKNYTTENWLLKINSSAILEFYI